MLTVVFHKKSSQYFLDRYRPLFEPYLDTGQIAFCFWDEHGTDFKSTIHELSQIVRGVDKWKAIIVSPLSDELSDIPIEETSRDNPFDFLCNSDPEPIVHESSIPLIRLAQMLGGVPLVNKHFSQVMQTDENHNMRMGIVREEEDAFLEEQQKVWNELNDKYQFNCTKPSKLLLFSARESNEINIPTTTDREQMSRHECDSSMFWYRNRYPAKARFLVQDCSRPGHVNYYKDLFNFWMTVFTLAINEEPPGLFEAYKLYHVKGILELDKVQSALSDYYNRLYGAQYSAKRQIMELQKSLEPVREMDELPIYDGHVSVEFRLDNKDELYISAKRIGFAGDSPIKEEPWWYSAVAKSKMNLIKMYNSIRIVLDKASHQCRFQSKLMDEELYELDEYQIKEMNEQLSEIEKEILTFSTYSILPIKMYLREMDIAKRAGGTSMRKRMTKKMTLSAIVLVLLIYVAGFIPDFFMQIKEMEAVGVLQVLLLTTFGVPFILLVIYGCLYHFRAVIRAKIHNYNAIISKFVMDLNNAGKAFSGYLTKCCSYMRGIKILQVLNHRSIASTDIMLQLSNHVDRLQDQLEIIKNWLLDFDLKVLPDKKGKYGVIDFDFDIPPEKNREYLIQLDRWKLDIWLEDGSRYMAPYPFITGFDVKRIPLFEKVELTEESEEEYNDQ